MTIKEGAIVAEHYQLKKQLGHGSFGDVWLAYNLLADIDVAIKFYGTFDQEGLEDFRNEFKMAYKLRHPNLLNINHFDVYDNCPYLVMPYCQNGSVSHHVGQMEESEIWKFILDVSGGLAYLHSQQPPIVHQDIKPDNILITSEGRYVITDFGISRSFRSKMSRTNNRSNSSGTIAYMGPERFSEKPMIVLASDIWAFGMTLYELLTGDVLWEGMGGSVQLNGARIPSISSNISSELAQLVMSCLSVETWNRPTALQIYEYASAYLQKKPLPQLPIQKATYEEPASQKPIPVSYNNQPSKNAVPVSYNNQPAKNAVPVRHEAVKINHHVKEHNSSTPSAQNKSRMRNVLLIALPLLIVLAGFTGIVVYLNKQAESRVSAVRTHIKSSNKKQEAEPAATVQPVNEKGPTATQPAKEQTVVVKKAIPDKHIPDDRIEFTTSKPDRPTNTRTSTNNLNDDEVFYSCQSVSDYQSYLNTFPGGRHRSQAQNAINEILERNNNMTNSQVQSTPRRTPPQEVPVNGYRQERPQGVQRGYSSPPPNRGNVGNSDSRSPNRVSPRGGGGATNGGGSVHRHSN